MTVNANGDMDEQLSEVSLPVQKMGCLPEQKTGQK